jgi:hypothetical protein
LEVRRYILLPAARVEPLIQVALAIKQRNSNRRQTEIARLFDVIARKHTETAGVDRQARMQAKFGRKVGKSLCGKFGTMETDPCIAWRRRHDRVELSDDRVVPADKLGVGGGRFENFWR